MDEEIAKYEQNVKVARKALVDLAARIDVIKFTIAHNEGALKALKELKDNGDIPVQ